MLQRIYNYRIQHNKNIITIHSKWTITSLNLLSIHYTGRVKSKTDKLAPVASLVNVHYLRLRTGMVEKKYTKVYPGTRQYSHMIQKCIANTVT